MTLAPGTKFGPYEIVAPLGAGGMGEVYLARDARLNREVAIKVLAESLAQDPAALARFEREAKAVAALNHPNILSIHDYGHEGDLTYAVIELLEGETLQQRLAQSALPVSKAVEIARQIAQGLSAAHEKGIIHRDLKPGNIFLSKGGPVKILDFGLARTTGPLTLVDSAGSQSPTADLGTRPGVVLGTVGYMAPEQVRGNPADGRADIFALGAVLYEMVAGKRAFQGASAVETLNAILKEDPPEITSSAHAHLPPALDRIIRHCLEKSPEDRFQSARDVAFDLENLSSASASGIATVPASSGRRLRSRLLGLAVCLLLLAAGMGTGLRLQRKPAPFELYPLFTEDGVIDAANFLPKGKGVVFSGRFGDQPSQVYTVPIEGGRPVPIPDTEGWFANEVAPNGDLYVSRFTALGAQINARIPAEGGKPVPDSEGGVLPPGWFIGQPEPLRLDRTVRQGVPVMVLSQGTGKELAVIDASFGRWPGAIFYNRMKPELSWVERTDQGRAIVLLRPGPEIERIPFNAPSPTVLAWASTAADHCLLCIMDEASGLTQLASVGRDKALRALAELPGRYFAFMGNAEGDIILLPYSWSGFRQARWLRLADGQERKVPYPYGDAGQGGFALYAGRLVYIAGIEGPGYLLEWSAREPMRFKGGHVIGANLRGVLLASRTNDIETLLFNALDGSPVRDLGTWGIIDGISMIPGSSDILVYENRIDPRISEKFITVATRLDPRTGTRTPLDESVFLPHPDGKRALCLKTIGPNNERIWAWYDLVNRRRIAGDSLKIPADFIPTSWMPGGMDLAGHIRRGPCEADLCAVNPYTGAMRVIKSISTPQGEPGSLKIHDFDGETCVYEWNEPVKGRLYLIKGAFR